MKKQLLIILTFLMVLILLFWMMPNLKIEAIGDFFKKILVPISLIFSVKRFKK